MSTRVYINAARCVEYLRDIGVEVSDAQAEQWERLQAEARARRRAHNRERKQSCGHFATHVTTIVSAEGTEHRRYCDECGVWLGPVGGDSPPPRGGRRAA